MNCQLSGKADVRDLVACGDGDRALLGDGGDFCSAAGAGSHGASQDSQEHDRDQQAGQELVRLDLSV